MHSRQTIPKPRLAPGVIVTKNIGMGCIGAEAFGRMLQVPQLRALPWILEVPGQDRNGPDRANLEVLRQLAQ